MEPKFIRIDEDTLINLAHIVAVRVHTKRANSVTDEDRADVHTVAGTTYQCRDPYLGDLVAILDEQTI